MCIIWYVNITLYAWYIIYIYIYIQLFTSSVISVYWYTWWEVDINKPICVVFDICVFLCDDSFKNWFFIDREIWINYKIVYFIFNAVYLLLNWYIGLVPSSIRAKMRNSPRSNFVMWWVHNMKKSVCRLKNKTIHY